MRDTESQRNVTHDMLKPGHKHVWTPALRDRFKGS